MQALKVVDIGVVKEIQTKYGLKAKVNVKVVELSTQKVYEAGYFIPQSGIPFTIGEEITGELSVSGKYVNLNNVQKMSKVETAQPTQRVADPFIETPKESPKDKVPQEVWEAKDRRMVRMNSYSHAVEIVKISEDTRLKAIGEPQFVEAGEILSIVKSIAQEIEKDIYRG